MIKFKKNLIYLIILFIIFTFFINNVSALTANSSSYSVSMFGTGMATADPSSTNYETKALLTSQSGTRNAESNSYTSNIGFFDNTIYYRTVSITSYSISPSSAVVGSIIGLSISALNYQTVWAKITSSNSQEQTLNLISGGTVNYVPSPSVVGTYEVIFYANSFTGAIASIVDYFELTEATTPPPGGSGGGGSTTTIIEKCTYNWDCTPWGVCSDGEQTRECKNIGTCKGIESKPIEEMNCTKALFDITLKLKSIELTKNKTLNFSIDLTEKMGVEKIDVHIKYSIINKEGYEIFSRIETKAIQGNLSYEKEIEEIKLADGEYILRVDILYGNLQRAFAEQKFEVKKGELEITPKEKRIISNLLIIFGSLIFIVILISFILIKLIRKKKLGKLKTHREYKNKIKQNLKRIRSKTFLMILLGFMIVGILFIGGNNMTGFVVGSTSAVNDNWNIFGFVLIIGMLGLLVFTYRKKIAEKIETKRMNKHSKDSLRGLIKKKVYTEQGNCIGKVEDVILGENKIDNLKIKLDKRKRVKAKGIIIRYKNVKSVGHIVIVEGKILEKLNI